MAHCAGHLRIWASGHLGIWAFGHLGIWASGHLGHGIKTAGRGGYKCNICTYAQISRIFDENLQKHIFLLNLGESHIWPSFWSLSVWKSRISRKKWCFPSSVQKTILHFIKNIRLIRLSKIIEFISSSSEKWSKNSISKLSNRNFSRFARSKPDKNTMAGCPAGWNLVGRDG